MTIVTKNSIYKVTPKGTHFEVEKTAEVRANPNGINVGWKMKATIIRVEVGHGATFSTGAVVDFFCTTRVLEVLP